MTLKRKGSDPIERPAKQSKTSEGKKKGREVLDNYEAEVVIEIQEDPETVQPDIDGPKVPLSARAARQAAIAAGLYRTKEDEDEEEDRVSVNDEDEEREEREEEEKSDSILDEIKDISEEAQDVTDGVTEPFKKTKPSLLVDHNSVSKFTYSKTNTCVLKQEDETYMFIGLKQGEDLVFMGEILVAPLYGAISIAGAIISSNRPVPKDRTENDIPVHFYPVFCPLSHALLRIAPVSMDQPSIRSHDDPVEMDENILEAVFEELTVDEFDAVIVIKDLYGNGLESMKDAVPKRRNVVKFSKKEARRDMSLTINMFPGFHPILESVPGVKAFKIELSWESETLIALNSAAERKTPMVSVVCGGKNLGKSSFSKYLVNRLLTRYKKVAYIETDVGQTEFTPTGLISLHYIEHPVLGPSYTHQQFEPARSFFFGSNSPRSNPDYYLACIHQLVCHWKHDQMMEDDEIGIPLVVNTQGWISNVGYDLLMSQIKSIAPTDVFALRHSTYLKKNLSPFFESDVMATVDSTLSLSKVIPTVRFIDCYYRESGVSIFPDLFTASKLRDITLASYFHQTEMGQDAYLNPQWDYQKHIIDRTPWVVDWRAHLNAIWITYEEVKLEELLYALNGCIVGIMGDVEDFKKQKGPDRAISADENEFTPPIYYTTRDKLPPNPENITCLGLGIIRAIDPSRHALLLVTPLPAETLEKTSGLIKGEMRLPSWAFLDDKLGTSNGIAKVPWKQVPYVNPGPREGVGARIQKVRRNLLHRPRRIKEGHK
ncbi:uncharacterized protein RHIMIDRAFT_312531 [Rhizopus microsporus ATCC 52813]|uniref:Polynucleotide 5'-hydroxyl-kinase GRC3 n=1 Tax=Rhizopus microsporus ATCC 52813 TaxID=1340429 RepID=A0A2G4T005_RHIZD|nr:uncharacterized protein RHIMIDRAFT_312531 [Rhizopus microsporus ATCC 52813]PHZ14331.1 hypothetical protein RHIMIDRAFT_312531 [Rhizopus microsporus ATCC 52813]